MTELQLKWSCPVCLGATLQKSTIRDNAPLTLDYCKRCGGIWFDHGEVQRLRVLARVRVDRQARAQHEVGAEHVFAHVEHQRVRGEVGEHRALGQQRVDALAFVAFKVVAAHLLAFRAVGAGQLAKRAREPGRVVRLDDHAGPRIASEIGCRAPHGHDDRLA
jgi:Zn-finger nucleic acid-binding protein